MTKNEYDLKIEKLISWAQRILCIWQSPLASDEEYDLLARECFSIWTKPYFIPSNSK